MKRMIAGAFAATLTSFGAFAAPAHAPSAVVRYADLDIRHDAGAQELWMRVQSAARRVCGAEPSLGDLHASTIWDNCVTKAEETAVNRINSPLVSTLAGFPAGGIRTANN